MNTTEGGAVPATQQVRQWAFFLHLSQLAGLIVPFAGLIVPIVIWQMKKSEFPAIDAHGKAVVNWILSLLIYCAIAFVLSFLVIGIPVLILLALLALVFPIVGAIKANHDEVWKYPLSFPFVK